MVTRKATLRCPLREVQTRRNKAVTNRLPPTYVVRKKLPERKLREAALGLAANREVQADLSEARNDLDAVGAASNAAPSENHIRIAEILERECAGCAG
jgi:hypothetical protein